MLQSDWVTSRSFQLLRLDLSFIGYCVLGGRWSSALERGIQSILFTEDEVEYRDFCRKYGYDEGDKAAWRKWTNKKCDILALWSHIWYNGDIFVADDNHFHKPAKKLKLIELGAGKILRPLEVVEMLDC